MPNCGLCREKVAKLRKSHLIPRAAYKLLRDETRPSPHHVLVDGRRAVVMPFQVWKRFLCKRCEDLFNKKGENYVLKQAPQPDGTFRLRTLLGFLNAFDYSETWAPVRNLEEADGDHVEAFNYFAASVFWKAGATEWPLRHGSAHTELRSLRHRFRDYLLGKRRSYPKDTALILRVNTRENLLGEMQLYWHSSDGYDYHAFGIPGLYFELYLGKGMPSHLRSKALNTPGPKAVILEDFFSPHHLDGKLKFLQGVEPVGELARRRGSRTRGK